MKYLLILFGLFEIYRTIVSCNPPHRTPVAEMPLMWEDESISYHDALICYRTALNEAKLPKHPKSHPVINIGDLGLPLMWEDESIDYYGALEAFRTA